MALFSASLRKIASNQNIHNIMLEQIPKGSKIIFDTMIQFLSEEIQGVAIEKCQKEITLAQKWFNSGSYLILSQ